MTDSAVADAEVRAPVGGAAASFVLPVERSMRLEARLGLWLLGFLVALGLSAWYTQGSGVHNDFTQNVWLPARLLLDGANPYSPTRAQVDTALGEYSADFTAFNSGATYKFIYPVWLALLFAPFGAMPLVAATVVWRALNMLLLVWSVGTLLRSSNPAFRQARPAAIGAIVLAVFLAFISRETLLTLIIGQFSIVELGLLAWVWVSLVSSSKTGATRNSQLGTRNLLIGVALAVLATKPQAVGLPVVLIGLWAISRGRWAIPVSAVAAMAALLLVPVLFYPWSLESWLGVVVGGQAQSQVYVSASVWGVAYQWMGRESPWALVALALTLAGLAALIPWWRRDLKDKVSPVPVGLLVTLCVNSVISPYMLGYEHVLLLMPAVVLLAALGLPDEEAQIGQANKRRLWRGAIYTWMALLPLLVVVAQFQVDKEYPAIAHSITMLALCWLLKPGWTTGEELRITNYELQTMDNRRRTTDDGR